MQKDKKYNKVDTNLGISSTQAVRVFLAFKRALCKWWIQKAFEGKVNNLTRVQTIQLSWFIKVGQKSVKVSTNIFVWSLTGIMEMRKITYCLWRNCQLSVCLNSTLFYFEHGTGRSATQR